MALASFFLASIYRVEADDIRPPAIALEVPLYIRYIRPMNAPHDSRTFKSGNSVAVRLHRALGLPEGVDVTTEPLGGGVWIRPKVLRPSLAAMAAKLLAMGPVGEIEQRITDLPERLGL
jgi:virulence-associated protein VagC